MGAHQPLLLFFDTFSHEIVEELNLDLVQFPNPVIVEEIRVIPLGARVQANFPGGVRLGATNPAQFRLEFFVNDLSKAGASTFESLGVLEYSQDGKIHMETEKRIPTDGLVLRGYYTAITLAVYGSMSKYTAEQLAQQAAKHQAENSTSSTAETGNSQEDPASPSNSEVKPVVGSKTDLSVPDGEDDAHGPWPHSQPKPPQKSPQPPSIELTNEPSPVETPVENYEKNSYQRTGLRERRPGSPTHDDRTHRRSRSRSKEREWSLNGRRSDSGERWSDRRAKSRDRSRSPVARDHHAYRKSRSPTPDRRSPMSRGRRSSSPPRCYISPKNLSSRSRSSVSPARSRQSRTRSRSPSLQPKVERVTTPDVLDDVSDISDGDIPDVPEKEFDDMTEMDSKPVSKSGSDEALDMMVDIDPDRKLARPEDIEEISDEEAEWSDEGDPVYPMDFEIDFPDDLDFPQAKEFDYYSSELKPLSFFSLYEPSGSLQIDPIVEDLSRLIELKDKSSTSEWVEAIEQITPYVRQLSESQENTEVLVEASLNGLNLQQALAQPQPPFKVRHLKSGLKFTISLLDIGGGIAQALIDLGIQEKLMALLHEPNMAVSLKLLIIRAVDGTLNEQSGVDIFTNRDKNTESMYSRVVSALSTKKMSMRLKCALSAVVAKVHLYELLEQLQDCCEQVVRWSEANGDLPVGHETANTILACLEQVLVYFSRAQVLIAQPAKFLPTRSHYELNDSQFVDPFRGFFSLLHNSRTLAVLLELTVNPATGLHSGIAASVRKILSEFLKNLSGLIFLNSHPEETNSILRALLVERDSSEKFAIYMSSSLHAFAAVDRLFCLCQNKTRKEMETLEVLETVQTLHSLTMNTTGRLAVVSLLAKGNLLEVLIRLVQHSSSDESDSKRDMKRSAIRGYASEVLLLIVRSSGDVGYLKKFIKVLVNIGSQDEASRLYELLAWLAPFNDEKIFTLEGLPTLIEIIQRTADKLSPLSQELLTAVRIIGMQCTEPKLIKMDDSEVEEQKYKMTLISVYSLDVIDMFVSLLTKICSYHEQPALHVATFAGNNGYMLLSVIKPILETIKNVLGHILKSQQTEFKDTTAVPVLLRIHALSSVVSPSASGFFLSRKVCKDVMTILVFYTQSGVWKEMVREILKFTSSAPHTFMPGLEILSQLLPIALPLQTPTQLSDAELNHLETMRNLWSAHLIPLGPELCDTLGTLCVCSTVPLQRLLLRVCTQLADLSAPVASTVVKAILLALKRKIGENVDATEKILAFLQALLDQPTCKSAFIQLTSSASEEKDLLDVPNLFASILSSPESGSWSSDIQESVACCVYSIMSPEISLSPGSESFSNVFLANSLPGKDQFLIYLSSLIEHIETRGSFFGPSVTPALRALSVVAEFDFGLHHLRSILSLRSQLLPELLSKFSRAFVKENPDHIQCLNSIAIFIQTLVNEAGDSIWDMVAKSDNTNPILDFCEKMSNMKLDVAARDKEEEVDDNREEVLSALEVLNALTSDLSSGNLVNKTFPEDEPVLPTPDSLLQQFQKRQIIVESDITDDRITSDIWFGASQLRTIGDEEQNVVAIDLLEISEHLSQDFNLVSEVQKVCNEKMVAMENRKKKTKKSVLEAKALQNKDLISTFKAGGAVPPLGAGRGFPRPNQRLDAFRSRPPNTSRPPSLHVDDFLVLQSRGQQPTGPTGYNKQTLKAAQELFAQREAKKAAVGFREATKEPVYTSPAPSRGRMIPGVPRNPLGSSKLSFRGGRGGEMQYRPTRGMFNRDRFTPRGWPPSQRGDYGSRGPEGHFRSSSRPLQDRKMKVMPRDDRLRHSRSSMDR